MAANLAVNNKVAAIKKIKLAKIFLGVLKNKDVIFLTPVNKIVLKISLILIKILVNNKDVVGFLQAQMVFHGALNRLNQHVILIFLPVELVLVKKTMILCTDIL